MNKYNIEVGDLIEIISKFPVNKIENNGIWLGQKISSEPDSFYEFDVVNQYIIKQRWTLHKMNKKIIGYKLLKDTPGTDAGQVIKLDGAGRGNWINKYGKNVGFDVEALQQTEWFEPIYETKPTEVFVDTLAGKVRVTKDYLILKNQQIKTSNITKLRAYVLGESLIDSEYKVVIKTISIGCTDFNKEDIIKVYDALELIK